MLTEGAMLFWGLGMHAGNLQFFPCLFEGLRRGRAMKTMSSLLYFENPNQGLPVFNISSWVLGMFQRLGEGLVKNLFQDPNYECMWHSGLVLGFQPAVWLGEKAQCQLPASPASALRTRWMWAHSLRNREETPLHLCLDVICWSTHL